VVHTAGSHVAKFKVRSYILEKCHRNAKTVDTPANPGSCDSAKETKGFKGAEETLA
jgi:hypothetical protein